MLPLKRDSADGILAELKKMEFFKNSKCQVHAISPPRSSIREKYALWCDLGQFFIKRVGLTNANQVKNLYKIIDHSSINNLSVLMPNLVGSESEYLIYNWVKGKSFLKYVILCLAFNRMNTLRNLFFNLGLWLSNFHKSSKNIDVHSVGCNSDPKVVYPDYFRNVPIFKTYNDYTMRNMLLAQEKNIYILDIDAAFHPEFPLFLYPYHDISIFSTNLFSLNKLYFISLGKLRLLLKYFLKGYFSVAGFNYNQECLLYFMRMHYFGNFMDRSLGQIYSGIVNRRYIKNLGYYLSSNIALCPETDTII